MGERAKAAERDVDAPGHDVVEAARFDLEPLRGVRDRGTSELRS
jgi:hypothetical protein